MIVQSSPLVIPDQTIGPPPPPPDLSQSPIGFHMSVRTPITAMPPPPRSVASPRSSALNAGRRRSDVSELSLEEERALLETYFRMAHSQYPILLRHEVLQWIEAWRQQSDNPLDQTRWQAFFVHMVGCISSCIDRRLSLLMSSATRSTLSA